MAKTKEFKMAYKKYFEIGINRVSIGLQSANNKLLNMLGRIHNYEQFEDTYNLARKVQFLAQCFIKFQQVSPSPDFDT